MRFLLCLLLCCTATAYADADADFLAARTAYLAGNVAKLDSIAPRLKKSPLEIYVSYFQLRLQLDTLPTVKVKAFLARPEDNPVIDRLRREWLKVLGGKQQWALFNGEYPRLIKEDAELTCYALQARHATQPDRPLDELGELWLTGKSQPDSCGPVFDAALDSGLISSEMVWQRLRLSFEAGNVSLAKRLAEHLASPHQFPIESIGSAASDPDRYLSKVKLDKANDGQRAVALFALQRLAKQSSDIAFAHWVKIAAYFPVSEQHYFYSWLGYEAARDQEPHALPWYRAAGNAPLNAQQSAWRVRAALRAKDWAEVSRSINNMDAMQQRDPAWRYWKARALTEQGHPAEAMQLFAPLSKEFNFYGQLANEELATSPIMGITPVTYTPTTQDIATMSALPGVQRTIALYRMDLRVDALEEWRWVVRNLNDKELLTAAEIAYRNEMYDRAIGAADLTVSTHDFSMRYLAPYRDALQSHIKDNDLDEAWVYGLMRQESRFATSAKSNVGAAGLMQIMPSTARWVAKRLGLKSYRDHLIQQLDTNLRLGTYYMKNVLSTADDSPVMASAAYNAGPNRARKWRGDQALEGAIYAESIPFDETREYVKKVMSNTAYYAKEFGSSTHTLKERLGIIAAKSPENQQAPADEK
ncbi:MAG: transglycosylase SLT domain-containing protein [Gallionella sp.]|nr:transglycosylase SLT domain-containing protein [Gallionella sp.]